MRTETIARSVETQVELEQLRENVSQYSASESLNEVFRAELHSMQQELTNERLQRNKDRMHFEEKINKLTINLHDEKGECKRLYEEKLLSNTIVKKMEESLKKAESDKQCLQQQLQEQSFRLATRADELSALASARGGKRGQLPPHLCSDESVVPRYIKVMQENFNIVMALYLGESFLGHLFQERVLTRDQYDDIQLLRKKPDDKAAVLGIIINALQRSGDKAAEPFLNALLDPGSRLDALAMLIDPKRAKQLIRRRDNPGD